MFQKEYTRERDSLQYQLELLTRLLFTLRFMGAENIRREHSLKYVAVWILHARTLIG